MHSKITIPNELDDVLKDWRYGKNSWTLEEYYANLVVKQPYAYETAIAEVVRTNTLGLTLTEAHTIFCYTTMFIYQNLNKWLRTGINIDKTNGIRSLLNRSLDKMPTVPPQTLYYRGVGLEGTELTNFLSRHRKNGEVTYDEFISCANNIGNAFEKNIKIEMITKTNSKGRTIIDLAYGKFKLGTTDEALFKTGSKFRVISNEPLGDNKYLIKLIEID